MSPRPLSAAFVLSSAALFASPAWAQDAAPAATPPAATPAADENAQARAVVDRAVAAYRAMKGYSDKATLHTDFKIAQGKNDPMDQSDDQSITFHSGGAGLYALTNDDMHIYCDGASTTVYYPQEKQFVQFPTDEVAAHPAESTPMDMLLSIYPHAGVLSGQSKSASLPLMDKALSVVAETLDGRAGKKVSGTGIMPEIMGLSDPANIAMWFADETGLLGKVEIDMTEPMKKMADQMSAGLPEEMADQKMTILKAGLTIVISEISTDAPADPAAFAFKPGPDDTKVESLDPLGGGAQPEEIDLVGKAAPDFTLKDFDGKSLALADLKGKVVLMDFWATWCGPCRLAIPHIQALNDKFGDKLVVLGMNHDNAGEAEKVKAFVAANKLTFRQLDDTAGDVGAAYGVTGIPCTFLIDAKGVVQARHVGYDPNMESALADDIEKILKGENLFKAPDAAAPAPTPEAPAGK